MIKKEKKSTGEIGKRRKKIILRAAEAAFAQSGFKGTSINQVAELAKLPKTNVLYYFPSKLALYSALMQNILHTWNFSFDNVTSDEEPNIALAKYISEKMEMSRLKPNRSKVFALEILNGAHNLDASFKEQHKAWFHGRRLVIDGWIDAGKMRNVCSEQLLYHIWAVTQHYADFSAQIKDLRGGRMNKEDFASATSAVVSIILQGCGLSVPQEYVIHDKTLSA